MVVFISTLNFEFEDAHVGVAKGIGGIGVIHAMQMAPIGIGQLLSSLAPFRKPLLGFHSASR